jgi:hypothetical protein
VDIVVNEPEGDEGKSYMRSSRETKAALENKPKNSVGIHSECRWGRGGEGGSEEEGREGGRRGVGREGEGGGMKSDETRQGVGKLGFIVR